MKILHVTPYFRGAWAYGGIPRAVAAAERGLTERGHRVTVCTTDACTADTRLASDDPSRAGELGCEVRIFPNVSNSAAYHLQLFMPLGLRRFLRRHARTFDVAHIHGCHHVPGSLAARSLKRSGVPYILSAHGTAGYIERRRTAKRLFDATLGRNVLSCAARVVAVSAAERRQLLELGVSPAQVTIVPNALDLSEFRHVARGAFRSQLQLMSGDSLILYLGKLTPRKRLDTLVEAFAELPDPNARLVIAGNDMGYGAQLRQVLARTGVEHRTVVTGLLSGAARLEALADADVVAYASELEVFGLVPLEALMCGTPVIVANDSGCGEVVGETGGGLIVKPGDVKALRDALVQILGAREVWRKRAAEAAPRIASRFSIDAVALNLEATYAAVLAERSTRLRTAV